ncbi:Bifunctional P-protein, chorismate mutase/prephenate dehydratase [Candidatus Magnetomorum sp. HK-1]|nr:Bifunctional P-protein, chorismate mutase/prephenate dehydratase [Candidatus Magnetomorum sp. HK-1]
MKPDSTSDTDNPLIPCRDKIDEIDKKILSLLVDRQDMAYKVGQIKKEMGLGVFNMAREEQVFRHLKSKSRGNLNPEAIHHIFSEIISAARAVQQPIDVAYLGPEATFSHQAAIYLYGKSTTFRAAETIEDVFSFVEKGMCQHGIVPIENSYEGSVNVTMDLFYKYDLKICAEIFLRIRHHLLSKSDSMEPVECIYSHPMPFAQCRSWLRSNYPHVPTQKVESTSTAAIIAQKNPKAAAIGSRLAAMTYKLNMLSENIEDQPDNVTRFLIVSRNHAESTGKDKTSLLFFLNHKPGALYSALKPLSDHNINMTRIESRPMKVRNWEYLFFADIEGHISEPHVQSALKEMETHCAILKHLGSYPEGGMVWD